MLSDSSLVHEDDSRNIDGLTISISSSSDDDDDDDDDVILLDSPVVEQQPQTESDDVISPPDPLAHQQPQSPYYIRFSGPITTSSPHRPRSGHISLVTNPYKAKSTERCIVVTVDPAPENSSAEAASNVKV